MKLCTLCRQYPYVQKHTVLPRTRPVKVSHPEEVKFIYDGIMSKRKHTTLLAGQLFSQGWPKANLFFCLLGPMVHIHFSDSFIFVILKYIGDIKTPSLPWNCCMMIPPMRSPSLKRTCPWSKSTIHPVNTLLVCPPWYLCHWFIHVFIYNIL